MQFDNDHMEKREKERHPIEHEVIINSGIPYKGGRLSDISSNGARVEYLRQPNPTDTLIEISQELELRFGVKSGFVGNVVWQTKNGFGMKFKKNW